MPIESRIELERRILHSLLASLVFAIECEGFDRDINDSATHSETGLRLLEACRLVLRHLDSAEPKFTRSDLERLFSSDT